jgi:hypothetical protein
LLPIATLPRLILLLGLVVVRAPTLLVLLSALSTGLRLTTELIPLVLLVLVILSGPSRLVVLVTALHAVAILVFLPIVHTLLPALFFVHADVSYEL